MASLFNLPIITPRSSSCARTGSSISPVAMLTCLGISKYFARRFGALDLALDDRWRQEQAYEVDALG
jgi:hypothetical protein